MATIVEMLDQIIALASALKGEAPPDQGAPPAQPSRFTNGMSAPDALGRVELELVEKLIAEFGEAPNGYRIPRLWYVPGVVVSHLSDSARGDYQQNVAGAVQNRSVAYSYKDQAAWFGKVLRVKHEPIPSCVCWNGSLADLEAKLRERVLYLRDHSPAYEPEPLTGALDTVAGYLALQST